jgi:hypothetical protein
MNKKMIIIYFIVALNVTMGINTVGIHGAALVHYSNSLDISSKELDTTIFDKSPGEVINEKNEASPSATLASIDYDGDGDLDYIQGSFDEIFISTNYRDYFQKIYYYKLPPRDNFYADALDQGAIVSADLNNDGQEDFIVGGVQGFIRMFINNNSESGIPRFDMSVLAKFGQAAYGLTAADFNDDGWMDFAACYATSPFQINTPSNYSAITIFYNQGDLTFTQKNICYNYMYYIGDLESGDFDGDGDIDILFAYSKYIFHGSWPLNLIGVYCLLENEGDEVFGPEKVVAERGHDVYFYSYLGLIPRSLLR